MIFGELEESELSLARLELIVVDLPQRETFQSAIGKRRSRRALFVRWWDGDGAFGIGECSCRADPYFSHEFLDGALLLIRDHVFPRLAPSMRYGQLLAVLDRVRGWPFARAAVLEAAGDLLRRRGQRDPLDWWETAKLERVPVGISLGLHKSGAHLIEKVAAALERGYRRVKLKIKPGLPADYLSGVRASFPDACLGVDGNGSFGREHMQELCALEELGFAMVEQPFPPDRIDLNQDLKARAPGLRLCLDESAEAFGHLETARRLGALDELNIKPGRVGGSLSAIQLAINCRERGIPTWVGGMFETGIGRAANLRLAARLTGARAHDLSPSSRYFTEDVVVSPLEMAADGTIALQEAPVAVDEERLRRVSQHRLALRKE